MFIEKNTTSLRSVQIAMISQFFSTSLPAIFSFYFSVKPLCWKQRQSVIHFNVNVLHHELKQASICHGQTSVWCWLPLKHCKKNRSMCVPTVTIHSLLVRTGSYCIVTRAQFPVNLQMSMCWVMSNNFIHVNLEIRTPPEWLNNLELHLKLLVILLRGTKNKLHSATKGIFMQISHCRLLIERLNIFPYIFQLERHPYLTG